MRAAALFLTATLVLAACGTSDTRAEGPVVPTGEVAPPTATVERDPSPTDSPTPTPAPTPEPPALELLGDGPYGVGATTVTIDADSERPLTVEIWFPVAPDLNAEPVRYTFITGDYYESPRAQVAGADQLAPDGPYPLVVYSHGSGGLRYIHSDYTETLASHGYVVAAADHTGNTAVELFLGTEDDRAVIAANRPADVRAVIDAMTDPAHPATGPFVAAVDPDRIAVTGHSMGGFTAYAAVAGATDDRIDAVVTLAPAVGARDGATLLSDDQLAAVAVPGLVVVGTDDKTTPVEPNVERVWELTSSEPLYRLELVAAEHQSFTDVCDYLAAYDGGQDVTPPVREVIDAFAVEGCSAGDMPTARVDELTNTFALRFLASVFDGPPMIDPADVAGITDIVYAAR